MSQVIEDIDLTNTTKIPYYFLSVTCQLGIFANKSTVSYSDNEIKILTRDELPNCYQLITKIVVRNTELSLQSFLMKNGQYFVVSSAQLRKNCYRSFIKTSFESKLKIMINEQGRVSFKMHTFLTANIQFSHSKQVPKIYNFIEKIYREMIQNFKVAFQKLKLILQPNYEKQVYQNADKLERLDIIKNTCRFTYVQPSFMKRNGKRGKTNHQNLPTKFISQQQLKLTDIFDMKIGSDKMNDDMKCTLFVELWQETYKLQKVQDACLYKNFNLAKIKDIYKSSLKTPEIKHQASKIDIQQQILAPIVVLEPQKIQWSKIYEGGFGVLFKGVVSFNFNRDNYKDKNYILQKPIQRTLVLKVDKNMVKFSRIDVQRIVLKSLKGKKSRYIPKFYQSSQKMAGSSNYLLTQFYPHKSLDNWLRNFGQFTSIFTKFSLLIYICYGLYFLHENGVIHRDLKVTNILIDSKMVTKITDFGQSYHQNLQPYLKSKNKDNKPGITLPYCGPQIFFKGDKFLTQPTYDMFSFGFIIFQIIFGRTLLGDIKDSEIKNVYLKQANNIMSSKEYQQQGRFRSLIKQKIFFAAQELTYYGPAQILSPILNVIERCLDPKMENRPHLEWVLAIIKQVYNSLLNFYSL